MVFQYDLKPRPKIEVWNNERLLESQRPDEGLTGVVNGRTASALEERFARALDKNKNIQKWWFNVLVQTRFQIPGQYNQVDFFVWMSDILFPIEVDGTFVHKSAEQKNKDRERDAVLNPIIRERNPGAQNILRIPGYLLEDQESADQVVREIFYG